MTPYEYAMLSAVWALVANTDKSPCAGICANLASLGFALCAVLKVLHG